MPTAVVLGCSGQDGTFLCRRLAARGYTVVGVGRRPLSSERTSALPFRYVPLDLSGDERALGHILDESRPDLIFHVAAVHASAGSTQYEPVFEQMLRVNVGSMHAVLEYLRLRAPHARALYASSAKVFGAPLPSQIDEGTPRSGTCLYSITKNAAGDLIRHYRRAHASRASQLFLFNHESGLRAPSFFIPKLVRLLAARSRDDLIEEPFATLDFYCDWGCADEYMDIAIDCLERAPGEDFVLGTGRCVHAGELVERMTARGPAPGTTPLEETGAVRRASQHQPPYTVSTAKLEAKIGRRPMVQVEAVIEHLVRARLEAASS